MTVEVIERTGVTQIAVLRRAQLDAKDAAIIRAVARAEVPPSLQELAGIGALTVSGASYRIKGFCNSAFMRPGGGLIERGWLTGEPTRKARTLRPGPRFAGLDSDGWPLEKVGVECIAKGVGDGNGKR